MRGVPPSIFPVVILRGSEYEMGRQYGIQAGQLIREEVAATRAAASRYLGSEAEVRRVVSLYREALRGFRGEVEMMKGIAEGASIPGARLRYDDILMLNTCSASFTMLQDISRAAIGRRADTPGNGCTVFSAWGSATRDGGLICGDSSDSQFSRQVVILGYPERGNAFMCISKAGQLSHHFAMNCQGLFIGNSGGDSIRPADYGVGVPWTIAISHLVRFASTADDAAALLAEWAVNMPENYHFADAHGRAVVVEATASRRGTRRAGDFGEADYLYSTNNFLTEEMKDCFEVPVAVPHAGWRGRPSLASVPRNLFLWGMLSKRHGSIDVEYAKMLWRYPGTAPSNPFDYDAYYGGGWAGWQQVICNLNNDHVTVVEPRIGGKSVAYVCAGPAGRLAHPFTPDKHWYLVDPLYAFVRLTLPAGPDEFVEHCELDAHISIGEAHARFMELTPRDAGYQYWHERMSQAVTAYCQGTQTATEAACLRRDAKTNRSAQAATEFARAQAYAVHVCDTLNPPPCGPEGLLS